MDWTPSQQQEFRPTVSVHQRNEKSVLEGPLPFYGSLPSAPKPPAWNFLNQPARKPIEQVVESNPFHHRPAQPPTSWQRSSEKPEAVFAPPKFFPHSDYTASTGLEAMFDRAFTIRSPEDDGAESWRFTSHPISRRSTPATNSFLTQSFRLALLLLSLLAWQLSQKDAIAVPGNYIEIASLGSASLIAGFSLLESLKSPVAQWNGFEILVYVGELAGAVHLGGNLPQIFLDRAYFDRYGKFLLFLLALQEAMRLSALYRSPPAVLSQPEAQEAQSTGREGPAKASSPFDSPVTDKQTGRHEHEPFGSPLSETSRSMTSPVAGFGQRRPVSQRAPFDSQWSGTPSSFASSVAGSIPERPFSQRSQGFSSQSSVPPLSFSSARSGTGFSSYPSEVPRTFGLSYAARPGTERNHTRGQSLNNDYDSDESDAFARDSDTETTATTATSATNNTIRNIRYGPTVDADADADMDANMDGDMTFFSPSRSELGPGLKGLSLDDQPFRRVTRSQSKRQHRDLFRKYPSRGLN